MLKTNKLKLKIFSKKMVLIFLFVILSVNTGSRLQAEEYLLAEKGELGVHVQRLQEKLAALGYYDGDIDGIFGTGTEIALKEFQRESDLVEDGIAGMRTWQALSEALEDNDVFADHDNDKGQDMENDEEELNPHLRRGDQGRAVFRLNELLKNKGFLHKDIDDVFDLQTKLAVKLFQEYSGLQVDGIAGPVTREALDKTDEFFVNYTIKPGDTLWELASRWNMTREELIRSNNLDNPHQIRAGDRIVIPANIETKDVDIISWQRMRNIFRREDTVIVTDLETGLHFRLRRLGGSLHADSEPLTTRDTEILRNIYGGDWSWERRAVIVHHRGYRVAASINGVPHGSQTIYNNNFPGHICVHFQGSLLHNSEQKCPDHHQQIEKAGNTDWPLGIPR